MSRLLRAQPPEYVRFFYAFGFDEDEIARVLAARRKDVYSGMFWRGELAGLLHAARLGRGLRGALVRRRR